MNKRNLVLAVVGVVGLVLVFIWFSTNTSSSDLNIKDINQDGIWDDVEPFIKNNSKTEYHRKALEQLFMVMQKNLLYPERCLDIKNGTIPDDHEKTSACLDLVDKKYGGKPEVDDIEDAIVNTIARARAYNKFNRYCSGGFFSLWNEKKQGSPCDFKFE